MYKSNFLYRPWLKDFVYASFGTFGAVYTLALAAKDQNSAILPISAACGIFALYFYKNYKNRSFGKRLEKIAQKKLVAAFKGTGIRIDLNVRCPTGGDIDAVIVGKGIKIAVEIKSWGGLKVQGDRLIKLNGQHLKKDPAYQAIRQAKSIGAIPLIWMPNSKITKKIFFKNVMVIMGNANYLKKSIK